jgi:hypothetical protein
VSLPLALGFVIPIVGPQTAVFDVPGRELQIFVTDLPVAIAKRLRLFIFGLEL